MKTCDYCGKTSEDITQFCAGCGTAFQNPEAKTEPAPSKLKGRLRDLNAGSATFILFVYFVSAVLGAVFPGDLTYLILPLVFGGVAMILTSISLIPESLKDTSPTGAAWTLGPRNAILKGLVVGVILGFCGHVLVLISKHPVTHKSMDPINHLFYTRGITQWIAVAAVVFLAPPVEEMLFRGILYGGYRKSFGSFWGAALPTLLFVAGHLPGYIDVPMYMIPCVGVALATLWCRLHWSAIAPAIAIHMAYNGVLGLMAICRI